MIFSDEDFTDIASYLEENQETYSRFYRIMLEGDLKHALSAYNPFGTGFTLFLPTDDAFDRFIQKSDDYSSFEELIGDRDYVRTLGRYHLVHTQLRTNEFPYGALPDTTATGDILTIGFSTNLDSTVYKVNSVAPVTEANLEMINGYIHVISEVLTPVNYTGFDWLTGQESCSILSGAIAAAGLADTLGFYRTTGSGQLVKNKYSILAEPDTVFHRHGIHSLDELIEAYATPELELTDPDNQFYQFAAYHILEGSYFLVDLDVSRNYNTYANAPVRILTGLELKINPGVDTFRMEISENLDTTYINHIGLYYQESDNISKNGPIHLLDQVMEFHIPSNSVQTFQFFEAPGINQLRNTPGTHVFFEDEQDELEVISWTGPDEVSYYKTSSNSEKALNRDYLEISGNFRISYTMPKILPGQYDLYVRTNGYNRNNEHATILVFIDGQQLGGTINLNSGGTSNNPYDINDGQGYLAGSVEFSRYLEHTVTLETFIPGRMQWDFVRFIPK